ncbi:MBL fold metallo-hydrolase [Amycolatopsis circi]|uniref:MBL fold metallo-hydrolase n=1 Tax=Amycolatopsis circi TaxID=871959 RepID=UPI000E22F810|nr:MBL fold metallo-hydrolase [Amycolatopsis circi]
MTDTSPLSYEVFVSDGVPRHTDLRLPDGGPVISSPMSSTLVQGREDAVLVDPSWTVDQTALLGDWIRATGKRLRAVYITHGHGDHWFGTAQLLDRFPGTTVYATEGTIALMHQQIAARPQFWDTLFPGLIGDTPVLAQPVPREGFELEGHRLLPVEVGHTDTDDTTVLHVPDLGLVVAGDVAYNGVHQMLLEIGETGLQSWLDALDIVEALRPRAVVAGHKNKGLDDAPAIVEQTRRYLLDVRELLAAKPSPRAFFDEMSARHPDRVNPGPLWYSALGLLS